MERKHLKDMIDEFLKFCYANRTKDYACKPKVGNRNENAWRNHYIDFLAASVRTKKYGSKKNMICDVLRETQDRTILMKKIHNEILHRFSVFFRSLAETKSIQSMNYIFFTFNLCKENTLKPQDFGIDCVWKQ